MRATLLTLLSLHSCFASISLLERRISSASASSSSDFTPRGWIELGVNNTASLNYAEDYSGEALTENWDLYQLRAASDNVPAAEWPLVSIPACRLTRSKPKEFLHDRIVLSLDNNDHIVSISYTTSAPLKACSEATAFPMPSIREFNTTVVIQRPAVIDPPRLHAPRVIKLREDGTEVKPEPEKGFLQKYWMYLLPILVIMATSGAGGQEAAPAAS